MGTAHLAATLKWLRNPRLRSLIDASATPTPTMNRRYWQRNWRDETRLDFAVLNSDGEHVGNCGLMRIDRVRKKAELWIYLGAQRGREIGSHAVRLLLERAFRLLRLHRVYLRVVATNPGAVRFHRRLGFRQEGVSRHDSRIGKKWVDSIAFSMLASEYRH